MTTGCRRGRAGQAPKHASPDAARRQPSPSCGSGRVRHAQGAAAASPDCPNRHNADEAAARNRSARSGRSCRGSMQRPPCAQWRQTGVAVAKLSFALGALGRALSWTFNLVADAKRSATASLQVASCLWHTLPAGCRQTSSKDAPRASSRAKFDSFQSSSAPTVRGA